MVGTAGNRGASSANSPLTFTATVSSAGHVPAILRNRVGCSPLEVRGSLLGVLDEVVLADRSVELEPGDVLVLCTDGVIEARNPGREFFGLERLTETIAAAEGDGVSIADAIDNALKAFCQREIYDDDVAIVVLRVGHPERD